MIIMENKNEEILKKAYDNFKISHRIQELDVKCEQKLQDIFKKIDNVALYNQTKVLNSFISNKVSQMHLGKTTGYGYNDIGRDTIEKMYAEIFKTEDALVRMQIVNGTHAISLALFATLMPNDKLIYITGTPYDTIHEVIGIKENDRSLASYGVKYDSIELVNESDFDIPKIEEYLKKEKIKVVAIQRSKGYSTRKSLSIEKISKVISAIKAIDKDTIVFIDNCYGEFVEDMEPTEVGADLMAGSLIKNIGGGLAESGGYLVGKEKYISLCAKKLTCPGIEKECGVSFGQNRNILHGLFIAPSVVKNALKTSIYTSCLFEELGFNVSPKYNEERTDIIGTIIFNNEEKLIKFIQGIQSASPIDSHVMPYPWDMPGYDDKVIMAAGTFIEGASIELSADSPIRPPYVGYIQGGITYESAKLGIMRAADNIIKEEKV